MLDEVVWAGPDMRPLVAASGMSVGNGAVGGGAEAGVRVMRTASALVKLRMDGRNRPENVKPDLMSLFVGFAPNGYVQTGLGFGSAFEAVEAYRDVMRRGGPGGMLMCAPTVVVEERARFESGIGFRIPPEPPAGLKGVVLHLWALASNPYEKEVMAEFSKRGWLVVDVDPEDGIVPDLSEAQVEEILDLEEKVRGLQAELPKSPTERLLTYEELRVRAQHPAAQRINELETRIWRLRRPAIRLAGEEDVEPVARMLAERIDATLAANAMGAEAVLDTVHAVYPETQHLPTVVMGFSAGSLSTPTVVARMREKVSAVVLVGAAANLVETAAFSTFSDGGVELETRPLREGEKGDLQKRPNRPSDKLIRAVGKRYLELSKLDPYHTAGALNGIPVLQVHAIWDTWVPAEYGELLYERLGEPDKLTMPGGHGMLFYFLPGEKEWIAEWVEKHAGAAGT